MADFCRDRPAAERAASESDDYAAYGERGGLPRPRAHDQSCRAPTCQQRVWESQLVRVALAGLAGRDGPVERPGSCAEFEGVTLRLPTGNAPGDGRDALEAGRAQQ